MKPSSKLLSYILILSLLLGWVHSDAKASSLPAHPFKDIVGTEYELAIAQIWDLGVVTGVEPDRFNPAGNVTRAQMAALIVRAMGKVPEAEQMRATPPEFTDVSSSHWAYGFIVLANKLGIVKGDAGRFSPDSPVNYAQAITMLIRALGYELQVVGGYPTGYVVKADEMGLLRQLKFELSAPMSRAEVAVMLHNAVFRVPQLAGGLTWSQSVFKRAAFLEFSNLPGAAAPGQTVELTAKAKDLIGNPLSDFPVTYRVVSGKGILNGSTLAIGDVGPVTVEAKSQTLTAIASIKVLSDLKITPTQFDVTKGSSLNFSATALSGTDRVPVRPFWKVVSGPATIDPQGNLTVTDYGSISVSATLGTLSATANGQAVGKVSIGTRPEYLVPGLTYEFAAEATDAQGKKLTVPIEWSATGANIDRTTGRVSSVAGQQVVITAKAGGVQDVLTLPVLQSIVIDPPNSTVLKGQEIRFTARGKDATGNLYVVQPKWNRTIPATGIINDEGVFVGTGLGQTKVTAALGQLNGEAQVQVGGLPTTLGLQAASTNIPTRVGTTAITVRALDEAGGVSPVDGLPVALTFVGAQRGNLSKSVVLLKEGEATVTFTASSTAGSVTIRAESPASTLAVQTLVLTTYHQNPTHIQLWVRPQPLATGGGTATIIATLQDSQNNPVLSPQTLNVNLTSTGSALGSLVSSTIIIPAGESSATVSFISTSQPGTAQLDGTALYPVRGTTIQTAAAGPAAGVRIKPMQEPVPVTGLNILEVQVEIIDGAGVLRANDTTTEVRLNVTAPSSVSDGAPVSMSAIAKNGVATFHILAYAVGTVSATASLAADPSKTHTASAEFVPGVKSFLRLTSQPSSVAADGISQVQVTAEVVGQDGEVLTSVNPMITFKKLVDSGATVAISPLSLPASKGKAALTLQTTRLPGSDVWYASAPGLETVNLVTVKTDAGSSAASSLRVLGTTTISVGSSSVLTVQLVDGLGQVMTAENGRQITASHTLPGMTITPTAQTQAGTATFALTGTQVASGTIIFAVPGTNITTSVPVSVGSSGTAFSLYASSNSTTVRVGQSVTVWVRVMDAQGLVLTGDNGRVVTVTSSTLNAVLSAGQTNTISGVASFTVTGLSPGVATLTFTSPGLLQPQSSLTLYVTN